jgi:putative transposase
MLNCHGSHSVHNFQVHLVWITKYRYQVLQGDIQLRCCEIIRQSCNSLDIRILKGIVCKGYIHLHISYPPQLSISDIVKLLQGHSSRMLVQEYLELRRRYWGGHFWGIDYGC